MADDPVEPPVPETPPTPEVDPILERRIERYKQFDLSYFDGGPSSKAYQGYTDTWIWAPIAEIFLHLTRSKGPILDWGCAKGYLVQRFAERGLDAVGVDVSTYAISKATEWVRKHRLWVLDGPRTGFSSDSFESIMTFETLEHVHEEDIPETLAEFTRLATKWVYGSIFLDHQTSSDPTHCTVKPRAWWDEQFAAHGWVPQAGIISATRLYPVWITLGWEPFCYRKRGS